jgi:8-amino-7-oxononanoate synthase
LNSLQRFSEKLLARQQNESLRTLQISQGGIDFFSNDYLGLARNAKLSEKIKENYEKYAFLGNGSTGSRLLSGNNVYVEEIETKLANIFAGEAALLFNSGYAANSALLATVTQKGDTIIYDSLIHASLHEGCRLSFANAWAFKHNDLAELEKKLQLAKGHKFVVIESIYSMDGDVALLPEILAICKQYDAYLLVDEAHSTGIYGKNGNGLCCAWGIEKEVFARIYTFGKAVGVYGACVVGSQILKDYLVNFAKGFIYTTALPTHNLVSIATAFDFIAQNPQFSNKLIENSRYFDELQGQKIDFHTSIKIIKVAGNNACKILAKQLIEAGFEVRPIVAPTVAVGEERIRICLHSYNTEQEIKNLVETVQKFTT